MFVSSMDGSLLSLSHARSAVHDIARKVYCAKATRNGSVPRSDFVACANPEFKVNHANHTSSCYPEVMSSSGGLPAIQFISSRSPSCISFCRWSTHACFPFSTKISVTIGDRGSELPPFPHPSLLSSHALILLRVPQATLFGVLGACRQRPHLSQSALAVRKSLPRTPFS